MNLNPIGPNQTEIERADGVTVFYSYKTPVAVFVPGRGALCTKTKYSNTTSRHINATVRRWGATRVYVSQSEIDTLAARKDGLPKGEFNTKQEAKDFAEAQINQYGADDYVTYKIVPKA